MKDRKKSSVRKMKKSSVRNAKKKKRINFKKKTKIKISKCSTEVEPNSTTRCEGCRITSRFSR